MGYNEKKCDSSTSSRVPGGTGVAQGDTASGSEVEKERLWRVRASKQASFIEDGAIGKMSKGTPSWQELGGPIRKRLAA